MFQRRALPTALAGVTMSLSTLGMPGCEEKQDKAIGPSDYRSARVLSVGKVVHTEGKLPVLPVEIENCAGLHTLRLSDTDKQGFMGGPGIRHQFDGPETLKDISLRLRPGQDISFPSSFYWRGQHMSLLIGEGTLQVDVDWIRFND